MSFSKRDARKETKRPGLEPLNAGRVRGGLVLHDDLDGLTLLEGRRGGDDHSRAKRGLGFDLKLRRGRIVSLSEAGKVHGKVRGWKDGTEADRAWRVVEGDGGDREGTRVEDDG